MNNISSVINQPLGSHVSSSQALPVNAQGSYQGQQVKLLQPQSLMASVAEEMSFAASEKRESDSLRGRKISDRLGGKSAAQQVAEDYLKQVAKTPQVEAMRRFADSLLDGFIKNSQHTLQLLKNFSSDISDQYLILKLAAQLAGEKLARDKLDRDKLQSKKQWQSAKGHFEALAEQLLNSSDNAEADIIAGININQVVSSPAGQALGSAQNLKNFYRETIFDTNNLLSAYEHILEHCSEGQLEQGIELLLRGLAADYNAQHSSIEKPKLQLIMSSMHKLKTLTTIRESAMGLFSKFSSNFS
ncbi:HrpJ domain-containing protein [Spartinivicinus ruber]|uniref:HrpJ domain-containing protein n=1 Tax=Spartinivicinus ruber TaxID=2683272 RepID=UPI0013D59209|nr:HrpJ domain-containing protein [Spartinivicinus ruber]